MGRVIREALLLVVAFLSVMASTFAQDLSLGSAAAFNVLASEKVTNTGSTIVQGNVGVGTGAVISGFAPGSIKGQTHINNATSLDALNSLETAYQINSQKTPDQTLPNTLSDQSFTPGIYRINGNLTINGPLVLNAGNNPNAVFIFQVTGDFKVSPNVTIALINGARVNNVLWLVTNTAQVGSGAYVKGNILAQQTIKLADDAAILGRVMSLRASVQLSNSIISQPTDLSIQKVKTSDATEPNKKYAVGDMVTYKIEIRNLGPVDDEVIVVRDVLPAGLSYVSSTASKAGTSYDPVYGIWVLDELKVGEVQTLLISARATMAGYIVNTATVAGSTVDENLTNNKSDADLCVVLSDAGEIQGPVAVCAGSANTYKIKQIAGATYTWTVPSDWIITAGSRNSSEITVKVGNTSGSISVTVNNICGASPPSRLTVEVVLDVPPKPGPISGTLELCTGKATTYSIAPVPGALGYRWTLPTGWTMVSDNGTSIVVTTDGDATTKRLSVSAYNLCGDGEPSVLDVTPVLKVPDQPGTISGPVAVCSNVASATYTIAKVNHASSYTWTVPDGWTILSGQGTTTIVVKPTAQAGEITVKALNDCGESIAQKLVVTPVENPPIAPGAITGADAVCVSSAGNVYSINPVANAKGYTWTVPAGWTIVSGQNTPTITVKAGTTGGKITVIALNDCGSNGSSSKDVQITDAVPPMPGAIKGTPYGCATQTATYSIDPVAGATGYVWSVPAGWSIVSGQSTTTITVKVGSGSGTISVLAKGSCGDGPARTLTVQPQVNPPAAPVAITGPDEVCKNQANVTYSVTPIAGITSYTWTVPQGWAITSGQGTATIRVTAGTSNGNITVTATNDCGTSTAQVKAVKVSTDAPATPGEITGPATVCAGSQQNITYSITAVAGATSYEWTAPGWTIVSGQGTTTITVRPGTAATTITVTAKNACGNGSSTSKQVQITNTLPPAPTAIKGTPYGCATQTATYTIDAVPGATGYVWTVPAGWSIQTGQGTTTITVKVGSGSGTISVKATGACGDGPAQTLNVQPQTAVPNPPVAINGVTDVCKGQTGITYSVTPVAGINTYNWTVPTGWTITSGQGTTTITVTAGTTSGNISVTATNDCGTSTAQTYPVKVSTEAPANPGAITGNAIVCASQQNIIYSITAVAGATSYEWSAPGWTIISGQGTTSITVKAGTASTTITVVAKNACGNTSSSSKQVEVTDTVPPMPSAIKGTPYGCSTQTATYSIDPVAGATGYVWSVPAGWSIVSGQNTTTITVKVGSGSGTISVLAKGSCGDGPARTLTVQPQVNLPATPAAITGPDEVCKNQTNLTYSVTPITGITSYNWTVPTGWTIVSGQGTATIRVTAGTSNGNITVTATNDCGTSTAQVKAVKVSTDAPATPGEITGPATVCSGQQNITYSIAAVAGATSYEWTAPGWTIVSGQGTTSITVTPGSTTTTITVTAKNACGNGSSNSKQVQVTDVVPPMPGTIKGTPYGCSTQTATYTIDPVAGATGYVWTVPAGWTIISGQNTTTLTVRVGTGSGTIAVAAKGNCGDGPARTLNVQPQVNLPAAPAAITGPDDVCKSQVGITYSVTPVAGIKSYNWTVPTGWSIVSGQGTATITVTAGTTGGNISVTATNDCGTSTAQIKAVKVSTEAPATPGAITGPATVCGGQQNITYSIAAVAGATSYEWSAPGWTIVSGQGTTTIVVTAGATGTTISVIAKNACGNTSAAQIAAIVTQAMPAKPGDITGTTAACAGKDQTYTVPVVAGATSYTWSVPSGWIIVSQNGNSIVVNAGTTAGNISVAAVNGCGTGPATTLAVTPITGAIAGINGITGNPAVCVGGTATFSVPAGTNVSKYTWEVPAGWSIVSGQGTTEVIVKAGSAKGTLKLTASNDCGAVTITRDIEISTTAPAVPGTITGNTTGCSGSTQKYSIAAVSGASSYTWSVPQGWTIVSGQGTTEITVTAGATSGNITVTAKNPCGDSSSASTKAITITSSAPVAGTITGTTAICGTTSGLKYSVTPVAGVTSYTWSVPQGWTIVSGQGTNQITVNAGTASGEVKVAAGNTCGQGANSVLAVTMPTQVAKPGLISGFMDACSSLPTTQYSIEAVPGATGYLWEVPLGWTLVAGQGSTSITVNVTSTPGTVKVKAVNACTESAFSELMVQPVATKPVSPSVINGPSEACVGREVVYNVNTVDLASSYTWEVPATWKIVAGQGTNQITVKAGPVGGTIEVMANNGCGSSGRTAMPVRVLELEAMGEIKDLSNPCEGLKYMVEPVAGATSYKWTLPEGWSIIAGDGTNIIMVQAGRFDGTISVVADNGVCGTIPSSLRTDKSLQETQIDIPNVFSPNGDGNHDTWKISSFEKFTDNEITVLNRWGTEVFKAKSYKNNWTGDNLSEGTYYYVGRVKLCDGSYKALKGYVMIVR